MGHVYSYTHADVIARFRRMSGYNVFYPMGYDDNGLPTERLVEQTFGIRATDVGRKAFVEKCLEASKGMEASYEELWRRLGLSIDWRYTYRTIDRSSQRAAQYSFIDLYRNGLAYRRKSPAIWCPECHTTIAQAELSDLDRETEFATLDFRLENGSSLPIATTRPELLPACVAVFVNPDDERFESIVGMRVRVPLFQQLVPVMADPDADPTKGSGAVMCCTFGDTADVKWWHTHDLPLVEVVAKDGRLSNEAGDFAGLTLSEARSRIKETLRKQGLLLHSTVVTQSVRVHERCDTPVEYILTPQWFIRVLDFKEELINAGKRITWNPAHMEVRYREWVQNLHWDWCISRQRYFGVPFPVWYCETCGETAVADEDALPVDPADQGPVAPCSCGSTSFYPESDVMDTWVTSSLTPQIAGRWLEDPDLYHRVVPMSLRPQAHEIIRTWAFYTIVKSYHHFGTLPWHDVAISGWGLAPEGTGKISKSRGGGPAAPLDMIDKFSADAVRYWATSSGLGKDSIINEEKIGTGARLVTKLWNIALFSSRFLTDGRPPTKPRKLSPTDDWILNKSHTLVQHVTELLRRYDFATAKGEIEAFLWSDLADNYLEMSKSRLYEGGREEQARAVYALHHVLLTTIKLLAPFLPYITEEIYQTLFRRSESSGSIHTSVWPSVGREPKDAAADATGDMIVELARAVRRFKTMRQLRMGARLARLQVIPGNPALDELLQEATVDIRSVTRADRVDIVKTIDPALEVLQSDEALVVAGVEMSQDTPGSEAFRG